MYTVARSACDKIRSVTPSNKAQPVDESRSTAAESIKSFVAGGVGGVCAVLVGHPFDLTKTRLQTAGPGVYTGALDVVKKTLARDGVSGMYRGIVPPLLGVTPIFAVSFWAYDASKNLILTLTPHRTNQTLSTAELATAGFLSAVPTTLITAPVERAKVVLQIQGQGKEAVGEKKYKGVVDVVRHLYREGGVRSIFRGTGATLARDCPGSAAYFAAYEVTKRALTPAGSSPSELNLGAIIVAGGTAGIAMWALAIPPDVLKSRIQSAPEGTYSGMLDCARKTIARDGVRALWKGFGPAMARAFPANAATFMSSTEPSPLIKKPFKKKHNNRSKPIRSLSASEIARNLNNFEIWSTHQHCEQVSYSDIPHDLKPEIDEIFRVPGSLPLAWTDKASKDYQRLRRFSSPAFLEFVSEAYKETPALFTDKVGNCTTEMLNFMPRFLSFLPPGKNYAGMKKSKEKWSEADYAANVYNVFRSPAIKESTHRVQCAISLAQPLLQTNIGSVAERVLNTKTVVPDCAVLIPAVTIRSLSLSAKSPFKVLKAHPIVIETGNASKGSSFRYQSTPCATLPDSSSLRVVSGRTKNPFTIYLKMRIDRTGCLQPRHLDIYIHYQSQHLSLGLYGPMALCVHMWTGAKQETIHQIHW
ncbi:hypothetical protein H0H92_003507 [Tricholoma furcatifolium]|nr:hypothetical protein H0H92_003507 [Tricholoma furcatifolium]